MSPEQIGRWQAVSTVAALLAGLILSGSIFVALAVAGALWVVTEVMAEAYEWWRVGR